MANIEAKIIADSISEAGSRLTTMELRYPRFIHAEVLTHRSFSRNASSSRAIPVRKMLAQVWSDPAMPEHWGANRAGMQARSELVGVRRTAARWLWRAASKAACGFAWLAMRLGLHKQVANRLLEPWQRISVVVTSTEWDNFFALRAHPDAQPEIRVLAEQMRDAMAASTPRLLRAGQWHTPYFNGGYSLDSLGHRCSVARCARVSYLTHDGKKPESSADFLLHDKLLYSDPPHLSPFEHQATPAAGWHANFNGWQSLRNQMEYGP